MIMNYVFDEILRADTETRSGLFAATAQRLGTRPQNVEKDLWVCWTLDALFNGLPDGLRCCSRATPHCQKPSALSSAFRKNIDVMMTWVTQLR